MKDYDVNISIDFILLTGRITVSWKYLYYDLVCKLFLIVYIKVAYRNTSGKLWRAVFLHENMKGNGNWQSWKVKKYD